MFVFLNWTFAEKYFQLALRSLKQGWSCDMEICEEEVLLSSSL